jgi:hypothetical protein
MLHKLSNRAGYCAFSKKKVKKQGDLKEEWRASGANDEFPNDEWG